MSHRNQLGYQCLNPNMTERILGTAKNEKKITPDAIHDILLDLRKFERVSPASIPDDDNLFVDDFFVPNLESRNIAGHFEKMARSLFPNVKSRLESFFVANLPKKPWHFKGVKQGWNKFVNNQWQQCDYIEEDIAVFDTETFVKSDVGNWAVLGTAVTTEAYYIWIHQCWLYPDVKFWKMTIRLGPIVNILIGQNVNFDRARCGDEYDLAQPKRVWIDTKSMFNVAHGLTSQLMALYEKHGFDAPKNQNPYDQFGAKADMKAIYNFYYRHEDKMEEGAKDIRNVFRDSTSIQQMHDVGNQFMLQQYAIDDVYRTFKMAIKTYEDYIEHCSSDVAFAAMCLLGNTKMPLDTSWDDWFSNCEKLWHEKQAFIKKTLLDLCEEANEDVQKGYVNPDDDPWLSKLDWTTNRKMLTRIDKEYNVNGHKVIVKHGDKVQETLEKWKQETRLPVEYTKSNKIKAKKIRDYEYTVKANPETWGVPAWLIKVRKNGMSTKSRDSHYILGLSWQGHPVEHSKESGWHYIDEKSGEVVKVPHKKGDDLNVGNMLTTDFAQYYEDGYMQAQSEKAKALMQAHVACSYWTSVRGRVSEVLTQDVMNPLDPGYYATITTGQVCPHNTVSGRGGQNLWYTVPGTEGNEHKIGAEIKTRVCAPEGWSIVGGDIDSQEAQIFAMYADCKHGVSGSSPCGNIAITGSKKNKDDVHYTLAKVAQIDRKPSKTINYGIQYGAGFKTVDATLKKYNPTMPTKERHDLVNKILKIKKGIRDGDRFKDGMDSEGFNYITDLVDDMYPMTPFLNCLMSQPLIPHNDVFNMCAMTRINWTIQRSGSEMLACMLVACEYLNRRYNLNALFCISLHDEIFFLVPNKNKMLFAACFLLAHIWTWSFFHYQLGLFDIPLRRIFISGVYVGSRWSKDLHTTKTISNPINDQDGVEYTSKQLMPYLEKLVNEEANR